MEMPRLNLGQSYQIRLALAPSFLTQLFWRYPIHLPEIKFSRKTLDRNYIILNAHFPVPVLARKYIFPKTYLSEITFAQKLIWQKLHLPELHFPENLFFRLCT